MDTTTVYSEDEKWLLIKIMGQLSPSADPEEELDASLDDQEGPGSPDRAFAKAYKVLAQEYGRLATMETRNRWVHGARQALSLGMVKRNNWTDAGPFLVLFAKLLDSFGWGSEQLIAAVRGATQAVGYEEGKNAVLFNSILSLPFGIIKKPCRDLGRITAALDKALYGMRSVKDEVRNQMVLLAHARSMPRSAPLLLVGPPGTGKTAVAQAIASALDLPFASAALGGNCDTIFLRGSAYAWSSATPGFFVRALTSAQCCNPVILLDELDKAGGYAHGDLSDTLTEVFDVNQAHNYKDLFLMDIPIDLSKVLWIATANDLSKVPPYIVNRCKVIWVPPYGTQERKMIIQNYFPDQLRQQLSLDFGIEVADSVASEIAKETESLREAKHLLVDLIARELAGKAPGTVKRLTVRTWDPSVVRSIKNDQPRRIGFALAETREEPVGRCGLDTRM